MSTDPAVEISNLNFSFKTTPVLKNVSLTIPKGSRCLLVGANGAGKTTLLQILAGKKMTRGVKVLGNEVFFNTPSGLSYLGTEWASNPVVRSDLAVSDFLNSIGGYRYKERLDVLLDILDVDVNWHMHAISDGERRRVQIVSGLMVPWQVLLLDEVTTDLDLLVRTRLLSFLQEETILRPDSCLIYATHIFDQGLEVFPTHVVHLCLGECREVLPWEGEKGEGGNRLWKMAMKWLDEDWEERKEREKKEEVGFVKRGRQVIEEGHTDKSSGMSDAEAFYRKYDYWKGR